MRQLKITKSITNRESMSLDKYLQEIGNEELLTPEEEVELAQRIRKGDKKALERLTRANLRFVVSVAKQYQTQGIDLPDLINEGNMGLIKAAKRFDETRGFKFISYAVWWIRQSILQAIAAQGRLIRLPANQIGVVNKITRILNKFEQENERIPNIDELAREVDLSEEHIEDALSLSFRQVSMDSPFKDDEGVSLLDVMPSTNVPSTDKSLVDESLKEEISRALKILSEREQKVLCAYYGIGQLEMSLEEIGDKFGLSRERVRQIKEKAIRNLRKAGNNKTLRVYLG
ncbi:sigma-70 family RNA polymerase sigma factor [Prevotella bivia]|uniref:DNA-directed RNA polymerase, sigma subunit (Sigma70/sigma32) n=1 Tax=Prevotella bivia DSM 20514 TaxID=868129 RepID=I4ZC97_9BACT|nr:RNA polymerase sigma factor RpoD/SigA [Prevotella bivia]EFB93420.1 Sigma-70 region 2 [Prevotella bivia JCVIHMP010]EIM33839.1 DNA-directed RNA polymerase, sigma subunit (sigma70/sigma32) [Prevotella bivia DSM 20514]